MICFDLVLRKSTENIISQHAPHSATSGEQMKFSQLSEKSTVMQTAGARRHAAAVLGSPTGEGAAAVVVLLQCSRLQPRYK